MKIQICALSPIADGDIYVPTAPKSASALCERTSNSELETTRSNSNRLFLSKQSRDGIRHDCVDVVTTERDSDLITARRILLFCGHVPKTVVAIRGNCDGSSRVHGARTKLILHEHFPGKVQD